MDFPTKDWKNYEGRKEAYELYERCELRVAIFRRKLRELADEKAQWLREHEKRVQEVTQMMTPLERDLKEAKANYSNAVAIETDWEGVNSYGR